MEFDYQAEHNAQLCTRPEAYEYLTAGACQAPKWIDSGKKAAFPRCKMNPNLLVLVLMAALVGMSLQTKTAAASGGQHYKMATSSAPPAKDPTKVYQAGVSISSPETDPVTALREEKIRQIMRDSQQPNYLLFNHKLSAQKEDLVYRNSLRLDIWQRMVEIRRENRRLGIFKLDKSLGFWEITLGILLVCGLIWALLLLSGWLEAARQYVDEIVFNAVLEISVEFLVLSAVFTVFNIVALYNWAINFQLMVNLEQIAVAGYTFILVWIGGGIHKIYKSQLQINLWDEYESLVSEQSDILRKYSQLKTEQRAGKISKDDELEIARLEKLIIYMNLRDDFIDPSFLPAVRESVFRNDFPFSDYLTIVHAKTLTNYMKFRTWCYVEVLLVFLGLIFLIQSRSDFLLLIVPVVGVLACVLLILISICV